MTYGYGLWNRYRPWISVAARSAAPARYRNAPKPAAGCPWENRAILNIYLESCLALNLEGYLGIYLERHLLGHMLWESSEDSLRTLNYALGALIYLRCTRNTLKHLWQNSCTLKCYYIFNGTRRNEGRKPESVSTLDDCEGNNLS